MTKSNSAGKKDFFVDSLKYFLSIFVTGLVGIVLLPVMTRIFTPEEYGSYSLAMAALSILQLATNAWLTSTILRFHVNLESSIDAKKLVSSAFTMIFSVSIVTAILSILVTFCFRKHLNTTLYSLYLLMPLQLLATNMLLLPLLVMRAKRKIMLYNYLSISRSVLPPLVGILIVLFYVKGMFSMFFGMSMTLAVLVPFGYFFTFNDNDKPSFKYYDVIWAKKLFNYGAPLIPTVLMIQVLSISDRFIIGAYFGDFEAGVYSASYNLASLPLELLILVLTTAASQQIVSIWENQGQTATETFLTFLTKIYVLTGLPVVAGLSILSKEILIICSSADYARGHVVIPFVSAGAFLLGLQWIAQRGLMLANETRVQMFLFIMAGISNIVANLVLVPKYGFIAAAWSTMGSYLFLLIIISFGSKKYIKWNIPFTSILKSILATTIMCASIILYKSDSIAFNTMTTLKTIILGVIVYFVSLVLTGEIKYNRLVSQFKSLIQH